MYYAEAVGVTLGQARRRGRVITRSEALTLGVTAHQLSAMVGAGVLRRLFPGVYSDDDTADATIKIRAGLAYLTSHRAIVSHHSAAWLQGLCDRPSRLVHLTVTPTVTRAAPGLRVHHSEPFPPSLPYRGLRCTTPARTLLDLAASVPAPALNDMVDRALVSGLTSARDLAAAAHEPRRGCGPLRRALAELGHIGTPDASRLEAEMRRLVSRFGLAAPEIQKQAGPDGCYRLDCAWTSALLVVELYGYAWHHSPEQMVHDLQRQRALTLDGWRVLIFTWTDVMRRPAQVAGDVSEALLRFGRTATGLAGSASKLSPRS